MSYRQKGKASARSPHSCLLWSAMIPKRIKDHAETTDHDIDTGYVEILEKNVNNWHKRIFLESWHSTIDKNAVNERKPFPSVYKTLLKP